MRDDVQGQAGVVASHRVGGLGCDRSWSVDWERRDGDRWSSGSRHRIGGYAMKGKPDGIRIARVDLCAATWLR